MLDVVSIGSATEDVFIHIPKKFSEGKACVFYPGSKVEIEEMDYFTGGGATNTSVAFARLGLRAGVLCAVGNDESGARILKELKSEKVDVSNAIVLKGKNTSYSAILTGFGRDRVILFYNKAASLGHAKPKPAALNSKWLYISSLHAKPVFLRKIAEHAKRKKMKIAFNPGQAELALGIAGIKRLFGKLNILILNREEALNLTGSADIHRNLRKLSEIAEKAVITEGRHGAHATDGKHIYSVKAFDVVPLDVTGAGDAFGSGFTAAMIKGMGVEEALLWGTANSNSVITALGTKNILLSGKGIGKFIRKHSPKNAVKKIPL